VLPKLYHFWYIIAVTYYEQIYDEAIGNNGLITTRQAAEIGIPAVEVVKLCHRGKLTRIGHGVYRIDKYFPQETDAYAAAVAKVGAGAYIIGESVLGYYHLCPTHEAIIHVGTTNRVRRTLPANIILERRPNGECLHSMDGVPAQAVSTAIRTARNCVEPTRLLEAAKAAMEKQLIAHEEFDELKREIKT